MKKPTTRRMSPRKRKEVDVSTFEGRFALRLRKLREKAGLTPEQAAEALGVSRATYFNWEAASNYPHIKQLAQIAEILNIRVRTLLPEK